MHHLINTSGTTDRRTTVGIAIQTAWNKPKHYLGYFTPSHTTKIKWLIGVF